MIWFLRRSYPKGSSTGSAIAIILYSLLTVPLFDFVINIPVSKWNDAAAPMSANVAYIVNLLGIGIPITLMLITTPYPTDSSIEADQPSKDESVKAIPQPVAPDEPSDIKAATKSDESEQEINAREDGQVSQPALP
jgi:hypothetical protein